MSRRRKPRTGRPGPSPARRTRTAPCGSCGETFTIDTTAHAMAVHDCESGDWYLVPHSTIQFAKSLPEWHVIQELRAPPDWVPDVARAIDAGLAADEVIREIRAAGDSIPARRERLRQLAGEGSAGGDG